jgi:cytochrome bd-type quinol oxidase subunit 2
MRIITPVLAIASGLIVLLGYFFPDQLSGLRGLLIDWAVIIAGMAVLVGVANLVFVQMEKVRSRNKNGMYGALLVISLIITFGLGLVFKPDHIYMQAIVNAIIIPVEASLLAILAVTLVYASIRLLRRRIDLMSVIFLASAVLFLFAVMPLPFSLNAYVQFLQGFILDFAGMISRGGARGLLIGVALGTLLTGLRVLFGIDRPYGGN